MQRANAIEWLTPPMRPCGDARVSALVAALDDQHLIVDCALLPTREDIVDRARPGATGRDYFQKRRSLLRAFVAAQAGRNPDSIVVAYDPDGAPRIVQPDLPLYISTAGRGNLAAVCLGDAPVGIDLEIVDDSMTPLDHVLHPFESAVLRTLSGPLRARRFLQIWTMKEAYLKACRTGFRRDPCGIAILEPGGGELRIEDDGRAVPCLAQWRAHDINGCHVLAACVVLG